MSELRHKVWIFTFEYAGIVKVGGLGEVPANQAKNLIEDFEITVFIPSHGQLTNLKKNQVWEKLPFNCVGQIYPPDFGLNEPESNYNIAFYKSQIDNVNIILLTGENQFTKKILDDPSVYDPDTLSGKICLFGFGMQCYIEYLIDNKREDLPTIIHLHDYHAAIPFIGIKQVLIKNGLDVHSLITIHLLTWPRYEIEFYYSCGLDKTPIKILLENGYVLMSLEQIFEICQETSHVQVPTVENIGAVVCDMVTTVSQSYLISDIIPNCGNELIGFKSDFIWDGCDWDYEEIHQQVIDNHGEVIKAVLEIPKEKKLSLSDMKKYLLTHKIAHLDRSPLIRSERILNAINGISNGNQFMKNGNVRAFDDSGPLVITTGRISQQKGFETVFAAIPKVIEKIPNAKFLFLILPTEYSIGEIKSYAQEAKKYPDNIRIIFGVARDIFHLAHVSADVYCALSRWEPFGIIALEAMASKLPIIATRVGGFQETIIDVRNFPEIGTGILIEKDNPHQFSNALISFFLLAQISKQVENENSIYEQNILNMVNLIPDEVIKSLVLLDPYFYNKIRENCYRRVENNFRWNIVSKKLANLYIKLKDMKYSKTSEQKY
ncbi:MAG: glycosyltransferase [Candidatus Hermodarchaeota archaeon]